jgi:hypothetical protein
MTSQQQWITKLAEVSPSTKDFCESAAYLATPGGADLDNILSMCIDIADMDVRDMGLFIDQESLSESLTEAADQIGVFLYVFNQDFFNKTFSEDHNKLDKLKEFDFLSIEEEEYKFSIFLDFLIDLYPTIDGFRRMRELLEVLEYRYNSTFITHIELLIKEIPYKDVFTIEENLERINAFIEVMKTSREAYKRYVNSAISAYPHLNTRYLKHSINTYDLEKIQPNNVNNFSWMELEPENQLSDLQKAYKAKRLKEHEENNAHHIQYYYKRPHLSIGNEQIVELVAHHMEPLDTPKDMFDNIVDMFKQDRLLTKTQHDLHSSIFSQDNINFAKQLIRLFLDQFTEEAINEAFDFSSD